MSEEERKRKRDVTLYSQCTVCSLPTQHFTVSLLSFCSFLLSPPNTSL